MDAQRTRSQTLGELHRIVRNTAREHGREDAVMAMAIRIEAAARMEYRSDLDRDLILRAGTRRFKALQRIVYGGAR